MNYKIDISYGQKLKMVLRDLEKEKKHYDITFNQNDHYNKFDLSIETDGVCRFEQLCNENEIEFYKQY